MTTLKLQNAVFTTIKLLGAFYSEIGRMLLLFLKVGNILLLLIFDLYFSVITWCGRKFQSVLAQQQEVLSGLQSNSR
jgi:uncharacterized phage infection (PIP) family protein YhgE